VLDTGAQVVVRAYHGWAKLPHRAQATGAWLLRSDINTGRCELCLVVKLAKANHSPAYNHIVDGSTWLILDRKFRFSVVHDFALDGALADDVCWESRDT